MSNSLRKKIFARAGLLQEPRNTCFPFLEGISDKRFEVEASDKGHTDGKKRIVKVPLDDSDRSRRVRVHEMAHAVISPSEQIRPANIEKVAMQRAEDMRCNAWNEDVGHLGELNTRLTRKPVIDKHVTQPLLADGDGKGKLQAASAAMATKGTKDYDAVIDGIRAADSDFADLVKEFCDVRYDVAKRNAERHPVNERREFAGGFEESIVNAEMLMELIETNEMPQDAYSDGQPSDGEGGEGASGESKDGNANADPTSGKVGKGEYKDRNRGKMIKDMESVDDSAFGWSAKEAEAAEDSDAPKEGDEDYDEDVEEWLRETTQVIPVANADPGDMFIFEPTRQFRLPGSMEGRVKRPADIGRVPQFMGRYSTDKYIFSEQGKRPGGCSVLIDDSGSMSLSTDEIELVLSLMPAATIAAYSGYSLKGHLVIVAKDGRRITMAQYREAKAGYSNCVDVPALEWLCKQRGPRYWVSDGYMTGQHDTGLKPEYFDYIKRLARKYKIYRIPCVTAERRYKHNMTGHKHQYSLEEVVSGGKRRRKVHHKMHMIGNFSHYD